MASDARVNPPLQTQFQFPVTLVFHQPKVAPGVNTERPGWRPHLITASRIWVFWSAVHKSYNQSYAIPNAAENSAVSRKWTLFHLSVSGPNVKAFYKRSSQRTSNSQIYKAYLNFSPTTINPLGVVCHVIDISKSFYSHFNFAGIVENTAITIQVVDNGIQAKVSGGIPENCIVPAFEVWIILD